MPMMEHPEQVKGAHPAIREQVRVALRDTELLNQLLQLATEMAMDGETAESVYTHLLAIIKGLQDRVGVIALYDGAAAPI